MSYAGSLLRLKNVGCLAPYARAVVQRAALIHITAAPSLKRPDSCTQMLRRFHGSSGCTKSHSSIVEDPGDESGREGKKGKSLVTHDELFERTAGNMRTKASFNSVLDVFNKGDVRRRGHIEFIHVALKKMPEFGVERDLSVYNKILDVFPKEVFVARNYIQRMFSHFPRQQECGLEVLEQMENHGVVPNVQTLVLLTQIFGERSHPIRKFQRMLYWFPKFKHINPYPVPGDLSDDPVDLARFALKRIANDLDARVTVYQMPYTDITETGEEVGCPHVVGIQSPDQRSLFAKHNPSRPVFVEGPFSLWLKKTQLNYYVLRADPLSPEEKVEEPYDPERCFFYPLQLDLDLDRDLGDDTSFDVDDVEEGAVYAMCMVGRGDQITLGRWISGLQETNPILGRIPTLFRLESSPQDIEEPGPGPEAEPELKQETPPEEEYVHSQRMKQ